MALDSAITRRLYMFAYSDNNYSLGDLDTRIINRRFFKWQFLAQSGR